MIRDHIIICPSQKSHLSIRKGKWVYIPAQNSGGFTGKNVGDHDLGGASAFQLTHRVNSDIENARIKTGCTLCAALQSGGRPIPDDKCV